MSTHDVSPLDTARLLQCVGALVISLAAVTSFDPLYWVIFTLPLMSAGLALIQSPYNSNLIDMINGMHNSFLLSQQKLSCNNTDVNIGFDGSKMIVPFGPNHREKKAERKAEREKERKVAREVSNIQRAKGGPSDAQIEFINKEQERRQHGSQLPSRSISRRAETS